MHRFVVVAARSVTAIGQGTLELLTDRSPGSLSFVPDDHVRWASPSGLAGFASWSAGELVLSATGTVDGGVAAVGGLPIVTRPGDEIALLGADVLASHVHGLRGLTERLDGPYAVVSIAGNGAGTIVNDPFGLHPLYLGRAGSSSVVSNDAALVAAMLERLTGRFPEPDEEAVAWLLLNGQMFGDATPFRGVERLPFGSCAVLERDGDVSVRPWHAPLWTGTDAPVSSLDRSIDDAERRMIATIRAALAATPGAVSSELTAGRDSRLVLQLIARAGVLDQARFCTYGTSSSPDGRVATEIARQLGLRHEMERWPRLAGGATLENLATRVRNVSGQIPCWEATSPLDREGITLSGLTGESLRTNYPHRAGLTTIDAAAAGFDSFKFGRYDYVRAPTLHDLRDRARRLFLAPLEAGAAPEDLFDIFYVQHRLRRWVGDKPDRFAGYVLPLYSPFSVGLAMAAGWEARAGAAIHEEIARRARPSHRRLGLPTGTTLAHADLIARGRERRRPRRLDRRVGVRDGRPGPGGPQTSDSGRGRVRRQQSRVRHGGSARDARRYRPLRRARPPAADRVAPRAHGGAVARRRAAPPGRTDQTVNA